MSVEYRAEFGIGYQINIDNKEEPNDYLETLFINDSNLNKDFTFIEIGDGDYTGEKNDWFIILKDPNDKLNDLSKYKLKLEILLKKHNISTINDFGVVGGLYIC